LKIGETLKQLRNYIGQLTGQELPAASSSASFSSIMAECGKTDKKQDGGDQKKPGAMTLQDYRNHAVAVRAVRSPLASTRLDHDPKHTLSSSDSKAPDYIQRIIDDVAKKYQMSADLINAVIKVESNFDPHAVSSQGAKGLMQLMPSTAKDLGVRNIFDIRDNIEGGARYLKEMLEQFGGKLELALAAYNAGPGAVAKHNGVPPYSETRQYVKKVMAYC